MKNKLLFIIIFTIILFFCFHLRNYYKTNDNYTILQLEIFNRDKFETAIIQKLPIIIRNFQLDMMENDINITTNKLKVLISPPFINKVKEMIIPVNKLDKIKNYHLFLYQIPNIKNYLYNPLSIYNKNTLNISKKNLYTGLLSSTYDRTFIYIIKGKCNIKLFNSKQISKLYPNNKTIQRFKFSNIDLKNINKEKYSKYNTSKFIEIILKNFNLIYIPRFWWFSLEFMEDTTYIFFNSDTIISKFVSLFI